jgi:hypothetical protein
MRLAKALKRLEQSLGPPVNEKMRRDAFNAAKSVYRGLSASGDDVIRAVACTLVSACWDYPIGTLLGNFRSALMKGENLSWDEVMEIESEIFRRCLCPATEDGPPA